MNDARMQPPMRRAWVVMGLVLVSGALAGQEAPGQAPAARVDWQAAMELAQAQAREGKLDLALKSYESLLARATGPNDQAEASIALAGLLESGVPAGTKGDPRLARAEQFYGSAVGKASGPLLLKASNNYATLLLRSGRPHEAASLLRRLEPALWSDQALGADAKARCFYNYGQAVLRTEGPRQALKLFQKSVELDPGLKPAVAATAQIVLRADHETTGIPELVTLVDLLIDSGELEAAGKHLKEGMMKVDHWIGHSFYGRFFLPLVRYFTAAAIGRDEFEKDWRPDLLKVRERLGDSLMRARLQQIDDVYLGELPLSVSPGRIRRDDSRERPVARIHDDLWTEPRERTAFSAFLKMVGDWYGGRNDPKRALTRYAAAWRLSTENLDAAVYLANVLLTAPAETDPDGWVLEEVIERLFQGKGEAYLGKDDARILQFHTLLASIFERQGKWGPPGEARSSAFQWEYALRAHERLVQADPRYSPRRVPMLHEKLGAAYEALKDAGQAWVEYLQAAEGYHEIGRPEAARVSLAKLGKLRHDPSDAQRARLAKVEGLIKQ